MSLITRFFALASIAISAYYPKVHLTTITHRHFNIIAKVLLLSPKLLFDICQKHSYSNKLERRILTKSLNIAKMTNTEDINNALQNLNITESVNENLNNLDVNLNSASMYVNYNSDKETMKRKHSIDRNKYKEIRRWKRIGKEKIIIDPDESFVLKLLSFNILAQDLLDTHAYLYKNHNKQALPWEKRKPLLIQEILESKANVVCLQEMQEEHLKEFLVSFQENGFTYLYKKRTSSKKDGLLLLYKEDIFNLLEVAKVEFYQSGIELLSRDNVGLIAKFSLKESPETKFVVATTHLLFNPRRNDVRLGQIQLLFSEIERISFIKNTILGPQYLPIILSGDFNLEPYSGVYKFITEGSIEFVGKGRNLESYDYQRLSNSLIPPHLYVTDECQHFNVLSQRLSGKGNGKVMLKNSENQVTANESKDALLDIEETNLVRSGTTNYQKVEIANGHYVTFSSGLLTHPFILKSVYNHTNKMGKNEATTYQNKWVTVDYIFYSSLRPLEKYRLPIIEECSKYLSTIPNSIVGSDHLCLGAAFQLKKR